MKFKEGTEKISAATVSAIFESQISVQLAMISVRCVSVCVNSVCDQNEP